MFLRCGQVSLLEGSRSNLPTSPPSLSVQLSDDVRLIIRFRSPDPFDFEASISAAEVDRDYQAQLSKQLGARQDSLRAANGGTPLNSRDSPLSRLG